MKRTIATLVSCLSLVGCAAVQGKYVPKSAETYPATTLTGKTLPVFDKAPTDRQFKVIGEATALESAFSIIPPSRDEIIQELSRQAAAAGGQALLDVRIGHWVREIQVPVAERPGDPKSPTKLAPISGRGLAAAATVIRFID